MTVPGAAVVASSLNVLLIDGNSRDRDYYINRLKMSSADYVIHEAATGHGGLDIYRSNCIDCVILELELPDMSGFGVLVNLVPLAQYPEIPVIVLTRLNFLSLMQLARLNGAYRCLYKSMSDGDLLNFAILQATSAVPRDPKRTPLPRTSTRLDKAA
jgi:CheY-like chemotaxis protein